MRIYITTNSSEKIELEVKSNDSVASLRSRIGHISKSSTVKSAVFILGTELNDNKPLSHYKIRDRSVLHYVFRGETTINIVVSNSLTNRAFILGVNPSNTVKNLKDIIKVRENILTDEIVITFAGQVLEDTRRISEYRIEDNSNVHISVLMQIFVRDNTTLSDIVTLEAEPTDTVKEVKIKLDNILSCYKDVDQNGVNFLKGKISHPKDYYKDSTLNIMLSFDSTDFRLFVDETDLDSKTREIKIFTVKISPEDTFEKIHTKIKNQLGTGINPWNDDRGKKIYAGQWPCIGRLHGDGGMLLSEIFKRSPFDMALFLRKGCLIFCEPRVSKTCDLLVEPGFKVADVKKLIENKGFSTSNKILTHNDVPMEEFSILSNYNIQPNSTLILKRCDSVGDINIFVNIFGKTIQLQVEHSSTIRELKEQLQASKGIPIDQQRIIFSGKQLEEDHTMSDYEIDNGATLHFSLRMRGC